MLFVAGLIPAAQAALVQSPWQPVVLQGNPNPGDTSVILPFSKLIRVKSDGTSVPFVLAPNQELVITYVHFNLNAVDPSLTTNLDLRVGPFYSRPLMMTNGNVAFIDGFDPGFRINYNGFNDPHYNYCYAVDLKNDSIIPGVVSVKLVGYLAPVD
ncbi:MAG: hypothetical protein Q7O12_00290 [Deltaproteobacteria bacterium]|nr:hypothetical protein [Deltaproteobacteria bacterium]